MYHNKSINEEKENDTNRLLCPIINKMKCKFCTNYVALTSNEKGTILQGKCIVKNIMVWRSDFCTYYNYNGV